jgi:orotate phosphoribosyltransferase
MAEAGIVGYCDTPYKLASGIKSRVYVSTREELTDDPGLEFLIGARIANFVYLHTEVEDPLQPCLIGIPVAGNVLAQAAATASLDVRTLPNYRPPPICHRVMRQQRKQHGVHRRWVDGEPDPQKHRYWFIDNVGTNGDSKIIAADRAEEDGYRSREMPFLIFIDRQQGAVNRLKTAGFRSVHVLYNLLDIVHAFVEMKLWPRHIARTVEEEIKANQFA